MSIHKSYFNKNNTIIYNKDNVSDKGLFKIDILSNRGLAQLFDISDHPIEKYPKNDDLVTKLFRRGNNIGLTFAESPAMRKLLALVKPKDKETREDFMSRCMSDDKTTSEFPTTEQRLAVCNSQYKNKTKEKYKKRINLATWRASDVDLYFIDD